MANRTIEMICIDSDVLIDYQRGIVVAAQELAYLERIAPLALSVIVRMELILGSRDKETLVRTHKLLRQFKPLHLTDEISAVAEKLISDYALSNGLRIPDALIAATALVHGAPLLSKNQRDFRFIPGLKLLPYPAA